MVVKELKRIVESSEITKYASPPLHPCQLISLRSERTIRIGQKRILSGSRSWKYVLVMTTLHSRRVYLPFLHVCTYGGNAQTAKIGSLVDIQDSEDPEGLRVFYYLVQDLKVCISVVFGLILTDGHYSALSSPSSHCTSRSNLYNACATF